MKNFTLTVGIVLFSVLLNAQPWLKNLPVNKSVGSYTLYDYKNAFDDYWRPFNVDKGYYYENGIKKKASGWKQFQRWFYNMEYQVDANTGTFPDKNGQQVFEKYLLANPMNKSTTANWTSLGTNSSTGGYAGVGRTNCVAFHPTDNNTYWVGAPAGGLWKTSNSGSSWTCLTDNNSVLGISDIAVPSDYATSHTIYIATGDKDAWDNRSIGVLKTTDNGATWNTTGLSYSLSNNRMVYKLLIDPTNNQIILAATSVGVYKTTDGGTTWSTQLTSTAFNDLEYKPDNFNTLYGSTSSGGIYVSTNGGSSWLQTLNLPDGYRTELAVSSNQSTWVYAIVAASDDGLYGVYKSTNSGTTFPQVFDGLTSNLLGWASGGDDSGGQGWYDLSIAASPIDASIVVVGGVNSWKSTNGGSSWSIINHWWGDGVQAVHADKHMHKFRSNGDLFECNDGGIYFSSNNGSSFTDKTNGLVNSQIYKLSVSQTVSDETITGLQDNGTKLLTGGSWYDVKGGDGMECLIDYTDVNIQYGTYVYGQIDRTTNRWSSATEIQPVDAGDGAWVTPYIIDPTNHNTLYAGYANVWKSTNSGTSWSQISTINSSNKLRSMAIAASNTQVLFVADNTHIWKTSNGGSSWSNVTGTLPITYAYITSIAIKNDDANTIWISMSGYNSYGVYESTNGGTSWTNISTGLPLLPMYSVIQNKQVTSEVHLYVGSELGVYFKKGTNDWIYFNTNLPNVKIGELEIYYSETPSSSILRAATYGRGLWETNVYYPEAPPISTKLSSDYCDVSLSNLNTLVYCDAVTSALEYEFRFTNTVDLSVVTKKTSEVFPTSPARNYMRLNYVASLSIGNTYDVDVRYYKNGVWSSYGPVCQLALTVGSTKLSSAYCNTTTYDKNSFVYCDVVPNVQEYEFLFVNSGISYSQSVTTSTAWPNYGTRSYIRLAYVPGIILGYTYDVQVRAKVNNVWGEYGTSCPLTLAINTSKLRNDFCNTNTSNKSLIIYCDGVSGAEDYEFNFTNTTTLAVTSRTTLSVFPTAGYRNYLRLYYVPGINWGTTYEVRIRVKLKGVWSNYGSVCTITYGPSKSFTSENLEGQTEDVGLIDEFIELNTYPNPFNNSTTINVGSNENIECGLEVFSITGQSILTTTIHTNTPFEIGEDFGQGIYIVRVNSNNKVITSRIIKTN